MSVKSQESRTKVIGNLPVSYSSAFNGDELALILGTSIVDASFVVECERGTVVASNARLHTLLELDAAVLTTGEFTWEKVIHPEDRSVFHTWKDAAGVQFPVHLDESFEVRLIKATGKHVPVNIALRHMRWKQREYLVGFVRDVSAQLEQEARLQAELREQKHRALEAIKSSLCVYQFNEKIKSTPVLTTRLLNVEDEEALFREAADVLTSEQGLNYRDVAFLTLEDNILRVAFSTFEMEERTFPLCEDNRFSNFIRKNCKLSDSSATDVVVPLKSRGRLMGVCEIRPYTRERVFFDESGKVGEWQRDVMLTIGDIIALLLDNLRLTREIKRQSDTDTLTGTFNRHYFVGRLSAEVERAGRYERPISTLFIDVDEFKEVNDTFGHLIGDKVLRELGEIFVSNLRQTDIVCRYGGDEFVALLPETGEEMATETAEKLIAAVRAHTFLNPDDPDNEVPVSISIGANTLLPGGREDDLLKGADAALYAAKAGGRNRFATRSR